MAGLPLCDSRYGTLPKGNSRDRFQASLAGFQFQQKWFSGLQLSLGLAAVIAAGEANQPDFSN